MPSVPVAEAFVAITGADATGNLTVATGDNGPVYPGALAWLCKDDGSARLRVKILSVPSTTKIVVRAYDDSPVADRSLHAVTRAPSYGRTDVSGFASGSHLCQEAQMAPVDFAFQKRSFA